ncbi:MAG: M20/M25/M40 family metallo-hydrolase, partial [Promethearchaeota archaeon]
LILALIADPDPAIKHGPLELLFTVDEETGLTGAFGLKPNKLGIEAKHLINLDSENLTSIIIGSAGGGGTDLTLKKGDSNIIREIEQKHKQNMFFYKIKVSGLRGGHSGEDISKYRANANKLVGKILLQLLDTIKKDKGEKLFLHSINGGTKSNAIPRDCQSIFALLIPSNSKKELKERIIEIENKLNNTKNYLINYWSQKYYKNSEVLEPNIEILIENIADKSINTSNILLNDTTKEYSLFSFEKSKSIINTIHAIPHGVIRFSPTIENLVETSNNLSIIRTTEDEIKIHLSSRSNIDEELEYLRKSLVFLGQASGWQTKINKGYPSWTPDPTSPFLKFIKKIYQEMLKQIGLTVKIKAIHAGLETGVIGAKIPSIQMISIGPTIENPHTPSERVNIQSVQLIFNILKRIVKDFAEYF